VAVALYVEAHGAGPPVVLAHGFGGSARNFGPQVRALRERFRVVVFDARGHARSEAPRDPEAYAPECLVEDLARVVGEHAGGAPAVVGGLSMGAALALRFALAEPARVRGLVLASFPGAGGLGGRARAFADAIEREGLERAGARFAWGPGSGLDARGAALVRQGFLEHAPHALAHVLRRVIATQPSPEQLAPRLRALAAPALVVAGALDAPGLAASRTLAAALPASRLAVIAGAGHVANLVRPRDFNAALLEFLDSLPALGEVA
jgi:pimeloyl-ACP methyl ester carboxylesterase